MAESPVKEFASLHGHSHFSLFDGLSTPDENVRAAKEKGLKSIALTDHGSCHGHADFYFSGKKHGVKTIYGSEAYVIHDLAEWKVLKEKHNAERASKGKKNTTDGEMGVELEKLDSKLLRRKGHLVLLACNLKGLSNLNMLTYRAFRDGFYGKPRMDKVMLREHSEGLVASSACMGGVISKVCWDVKDGKATWEDAVKEVLEFDDIFGRGRFFLELQLNEHEGQKFINNAMVRLHEETGVPLTVTTDFHYSKEEEWEAREILHMLDWNKTIKDFPGNKIDAEIKQLYVKSPEDMWRTFEQYGGDVKPKYMIEAFQNTLLIDSLVEDFEPDTKQRLPKLEYPNPFAEMGQRAIAGLKALGLAEKVEYKERMLRELKLIKEKGISEYFIIVQNIVAEAKKSMLIGAGRGSSAGSLVCYALGITDLDPIKHGLLFERFLDPTRVELPDIDIDFQDTEAAKDMLRRMFGKDNVACLSTWGTFQIKGLLKDLGRVYDLDHTEINRLNKMIEADLRILHTKGEDKSSIVIKLDDIERVSKSYQAWSAKHPDVAQHVRKLYGRNRHIGRHASGVVVGDDSKPLSGETSLFTSKGIVQTSFTDGIVNKNISNMGFVKFDILSIATLKVIDYTLKQIEVRSGRPYEELKEEIRAHNLDLNDIEVLKNVFWEGNFAGIFQFTEKGIRRLAMKIKPDCFEDVAAICSLYRPGPLGSKMHLLYADNKRKFLADELVFEHPLLADILKSTYGCLVYQEQLMQVCQHLGKMEFGDVQRIRKQLLKKDKSRSDEYRKKENDELSGKFIAGCQENGLTKERAEGWWSDILFFGGYGFNVAHAKSYSVMTMQCAHLATYHPLEFYSAVLTVAQAGDLQAYVTDIKKCGIKVLPVDVNHSKQAHTIERMSDGKDGLRLSFRSVLGVGDSAIEKIIANQPFTDMMDMLDRSAISKTCVGPLIKVGAFTDLHPNIRALEKRYEIFCTNPKLKAKKKRDELLTMFEEWSDEKTADYQPHERVQFENELMGFSLRGSPFEILDRDRKIHALFDGVVLDYREFLESELEVGMLPVLVKDVRERPQKNGQMFAFLKMSVESGEEFDTVCFATIWKHIGHRINKGQVYVATFNRKPEDPQNLILGKPGFAHSPASAQNYMINIDEVELT